MAAYSDKEECLYQNLTDARCTDEVRDRCMELAAQGENGMLLRELVKKRDELLETIHEDQSALDSLDYLIFQTERKRGQR